MITLIGILIILCAGIIFMNFNVLNDQSSIKSDIEDQLQKKVDILKVRKVNELLFVTFHSGSNFGLAEYVQGPNMLYGMKSISEVIAQYTAHNKTFYSRGQHYLLSVGEDFNGRIKAVDIETTYKEVFHHQVEGDYIFIQPLDYADVFARTIAYDDQGQVIDVKSLKYRNGTNRSSYGFDPLGNMTMVYIFIMSIIYLVFQLDRQNMMKAIRKGNNNAY